MYFNFILGVNCSRKLKMENYHRTLHCSNALTPALAYKRNEGWRFDWRLINIEFDNFLYAASVMEGKKEYVWIGLLKCNVFRWQWQISLDVASQCKGNGLIEIFVQVFATGRQKWQMTDRSTLEGQHWNIRQFWDEWRWMVNFCQFWEEYP